MLKLLSISAACASLYWSVVCFAQCDNKASSVFYINGILNTEKDSLNSAHYLQGRLLSESLLRKGETVTSVYNPTDGAKGDLTEVFNQILNEHGGLTFFVVSRLVHGLLSGESLAGSSLLNLFTTSEQSELQQLIAGIAAANSPVDPADPVLTA